MFLVTRIDEARDAVQPLGAFLHPQTSLSGNDTLLASGELYNNFTKVDVFYRSNLGSAVN